MDGVAVAPIAYTRLAPLSIHGSSKRFRELVTYSERTPISSVARVRKSYYSCPIAHDTFRKLPQFRQTTCLRRCQPGRQGCVLARLHQLDELNDQALGDYHIGAEVSKLLNVYQLLRLEFAFPFEEQPAGLSWRPRTRRRLWHVLREWQQRWALTGRP